MKIYSWNLNGIRAAARNGFYDWLKQSEGDLILLQEVRAETSQMQQEWLNAHGYYSYWSSAERKGYSGVGIYSRNNIHSSNIITGLGVEEFDKEGRTIAVIVDDIAYFSCYFPNSQPEGARLAYKLAYCETLLKKAQELEKQGVKVVIGGDFNIAHTELDLANPKQNEKNPGYLPEERAWFTSFLDKGYIDTFRMFEEKKGFYTWWSNRFGARGKNIGWRIDCHCVSHSLRDMVDSALIHANVYGSDHCPIELVLTPKK